MRKKIKYDNIGLLVITLLVLLILGEILAYYLYDRAIQGKIRNAAVSLDSRGIPPLTYLNTTSGIIYSSLTSKPDLRIYSDFGPEITAETATGTFRIIIIGDSFTASGGISSSEERYPRQVERLLREKNINAQVLSLASGGLNSYQELILFKEIALGLGPDLIILQYCNNDADPVRSPLGRNASIFTKTRLVDADGNIAPAFTFLEDSTNRFILRSALARYISFQINSYIAVSKSDADLSIASVREIVDIAHEKNIPLIIIYFPLSFRDYDFCEDRLYTRIASLGIETNVTVLSVCDYADIHNIKSAKEAPNQGGHYNAEGYLIAAKALSDEILSLEKIRKA